MVRYEYVELGFYEGRIDMASTNPETIREAVGELKRAEPKRRQRVIVMPDGVPCQCSVERLERAAPRGWMILRGLCAAGWEPFGRDFAQSENRDWPARMIGQRVAVALRRRIED